MHEFFLIFEDYDVNFDELLNCFEEFAMANYAGATFSVDFANA